MQWNLLVSRPRGLVTCFIIVVAALVLSGAPSTARGIDSEDLQREVKAAFLYNFLKFAEWPAPDGGAAAPKEITIALLGDAKLGEAAEKILAGRNAQGLPVRVRRYTGLGALLDERQRIHLIFLGSAADPDGALEALRGRPVLTVGELPGLCGRGVMINLVRVGDQLRFEINLDAARRAGLRLSSKLLGLALKICADETP